ncbi:MAG TPA: hypothetical protein VFU02_15780 [Polyangiaceae bacterium]|nr:hypothetical protein [Polyangiaceae bacterium]
MPSRSWSASFHHTLLIAGCLLLATGCGGQVEKDPNEGQTAKTGGDLGDDAGATETATTASHSTEGSGGAGAGGSGGTLGADSGGSSGGGAGGGSAGGGGAGGGGAGGPANEQREAASARAARFVNDLGVPCKEWKQVRFETDEPSAYPTRVLQSRVRPGPYQQCAELADPDDRLACWEGLACDFDWWNELDWSQWSADATVVEIVGPRPERINVASTSLRVLGPSGLTAQPIGLVSFYEHVWDEPVPPGCHDCGYYWYLDPTPEGVALVLGPPLAGDLNAGLSFTELDLCLIE